MVSRQEEAMGLAEKLSLTERPEPGLPCGMSKLLEAITGEDREALLAVLESRGRISNRQIHEILLSEGHDVAFSSVSLHRRKQCRCFTGKNRTAVQAADTVAS
jgi:hypothetical protein